jgi:hypothetical protein
VEDYCNSTGFNARQKDSSKMYRNDAGNILHAHLKKASGSDSDYAPALPNNYEYTAEPKSNLPWMPQNADITFQYFKN